MGKVTYAATSGTANQQYVGPLLTPTLAPEVANTTTLMVKGHQKARPNEIFFVSLTDATNAFIADDQAVGTIVHDDRRQGKP